VLAARGVVGVFVRQSSWRADARALKHEPSAIAQQVHLCQEHSALAEARDRRLGSEGSGSTTGPKTE